MALNSDKIRVLIVDDIPETRENVRKLLAFESDIEVVGVAGTGRDAIQAAKDLHPNIVLMDINMPDLDGISAVEAITQEAPMVQVIMMSVQSDQDYLRRSMLAGARDFLTKPFNTDELISTIRRVNRMSQQRAAAMPQPMISSAGPGGGMGLPMAATPEGSVIVVFSPKGGIGASTLVVNLAIAMQQQPDVKVAIVDASLQFGDIGVMLNLQISRSISDLAEQINDLDNDLISTVIAPHPSGIKVLLAPARPELAELVLAEHLERIVNQMRLMFDFIIIDTPSVLNDLVLTALDLADRVLLLTTADIPSIRNTNLVFQVVEALGYPRAKIRLVLSRFDPRNPITPKMIADNLKHEMTFQVPLDEVTVSASIRQGLPFVTEQRAKPVAQAVRKMAEQLISELEVKSEPAVAEEPQRKRGSRLFR
jgi:pilus assembly protein CpaE